MKKNSLAVQTLSYGENTIILVFLMLLEFSCTLMNCDVQTLFFFLDLSSFSRPSCRQPILGLQVSPAVPPPPGEADSPSAHG